MAAAAPAILAWSAVAGTALSAYGMYRQGQAASDLADYNAEIARNKALEAKQAGALAEQQQRDRVRQTMGAQRAAMGASGALVDTGSFGQVLEQTAKFGELDAQTVRANALKQAWGFNQQAAGSIYEGQVARQQAQSKAFSTLLAAGPDVYRAGKTSGWWGQK